MNEKDATHISDLYKAIRSIDGRLEHLRNPHRFVAKLDTWATVSTGNYPIEIEVREDSPFYPAIRGALEGELLRERELRAEGLRRLNFDVPALTAAQSPK